MHYAVLTLGFAIGLSSIGIDLSKFALFASALGGRVGSPRCLRIWRTVLGSVMKAMMRISA